MTLLETLVALVVLGLAATGFLELFQRASAATADRAAWQRAVAVAETTMESVLAGAPATGDTLGGLRRRVEVRPRPDGLREVVVTVALPGAGDARVELRRLAEAR
jgi:type II secretory pathway pseudopilin PulG